MLIDKTTGRVVSEDEVKKSPKAKVRWGLLLALILTALFSLLPDMHVDKYIGLEETPWFDFAQHSIYYFVLTLFLLHLLPEERRSISFLLSVFSISFLFELLQLIMPGRAFSLADLGSNITGIACASVVRYFWDSMKPDFK